LPSLTRRDFMRLSAAAIGGAVLADCGEAPAGGPPPEAPIPLEPTAQVAAVRGDDLAPMTRQVLDAVGGVEQVVHEGETVFIKPNMVTLPWARSGNCFVGGECAKPEIVIAVADECLRAGAAEVIIGDGSHMPTLEWEYATTFDGATNLVLETERLSAQYAGRARVASLEVDSPEWVEVPSRTYLGRIAISSLVARADRVISIPVAKTHSWAQLTLSLKNFIGITPLERYATWMEGGYGDRSGGFDHSSPRAIAEIYLDIVAAVKPDLAIVDFSIGMEGDGPTLGSGGRPVDMRSRLGSWVLLASTDPVAADATAGRVMSHDVSAMKQLTMAYDMGLGEIREGAIEIVGERLDALRVPWAPARLKNNPAGAYVPRRQYSCCLPAEA
jgi:uncharacterized protein (DUF362 family)